MNLILSLQGLEVEPPDAKPDPGAGACGSCSGNTGGAGHHQHPAYRPSGTGYPASQIESDDYIYSSELA